MVSLCRIFGGPYFQALLLFNVKNIPLNGRVYFEMISNSNAFCEVKPTSNVMYPIPGNLDRVCTYLTFERVMYV